MPADAFAPAARHDFKPLLPVAAAAADFTPMNAMIAASAR